MTESSSNTAIPHMNEAARSAAQRVIFFTVFLDLLGFGIVIPQLANYAVKFGASATVAGLLASTYSAMGFLFMPFWGRLSDRVGRRPVLLSSIFGTAVGYVCFALAGSLPWLFAARIIDGITGANISTAQAYVTDITEPEKRSKIFMMFGAILGLGFALGPCVGLLVLHLPGAWSGNLGLGTISAVLSLFNWLLAVKFLPETLSGTVQAENRQKHEENKVYFNWRGFGRALSIPNLNVVFVIGFLATTAFATMQGTYALFIIKSYVRPAVQAQILKDPQGAVLEARKLANAPKTKSSDSGEGASLSLTMGGIDDPYPAALGGDFSANVQEPPDMSWRAVEKLLVTEMTGKNVQVIFVTIGLLSVLIQGGLMRKLPKKVGEVNLVVAGTVIMAIGLACIPVPHQFSGQFAVAAVLTLGNGICTPVLTALVSQLSPEVERGEMIGLYQSVQSLGRICGPLMGSTLFALRGPGTPFEVGGAVMLAAGFLAMKLRGLEPAHQEECAEIAVEAEGEGVPIRPTTG